MNKNTALLIIGIIIIAIIVVLVAYLPQGETTPEAGPETPGQEENGEDKSYTMEESEEIARNWVATKSPTYTFDGQNLHLRESVAADIAGCEDCYQFTYTYESTHAGYGDREGEMLAQVITPHFMLLTTENGEVTNALTDGEYDEMKEEVRQGGQGTVRLTPEKVNLYYYNKEDDTNEDGQVMCSADAVKPVERIIRGEEPIRETIELLLGGEIREEEKEEGFQTEFPNSDFYLENITLEDGILTLEFPEVSGFTSGGSCRITILGAQIEKTARQFEEVDEVRFSPETLFQP